MLFYKRIWNSHSQTVLSFISFHYQADKTFRGILKWNAQKIIAFSLWLKFYNSDSAVEYGLFPLLQGGWYEA
jgi:hypothetical protein